MSTPEPPEALTRDLALLQQQEARLRFVAFSEGTAWQLGSLLRQALAPGDRGADDRGGAELVGKDSLSGEGRGSNRVRKGDRREGYAGTVPIFKQASG